MYDRKYSRKFLLWVLWRCLNQIFIRTTTLLSSFPVSLEPTMSSECDFSSTIDDLGGHGHDGVVSTLGFFLLSNFIGGLIFTCSHLVSPDQRPSFTLLLFFCGCLLSAFSGSIGGSLEEMIETAQDARPTIILYILLPILIFRSALHIEYHIFKRVLGQAVLLAGPGVMICLVLTALTVKMFGYGWSWAEAFVLASILSATDPVSVVNALQELGAPPRLSIIIEGESLLNDGSAYVLFLIFKSFASPEGSEMSFGEVFWEFLRLAFGGIAWGMCCGLIVNGLLFMTSKMSKVQISITIGGAFATFLLADTVLDVSSVLACVTYGIYMSAGGKFAVKTLYFDFSFCTELLPDECMCVVVWVGG